MKVRILSITLSLLVIVVGVGVADTHKAPTASYGDVSDTVVAASPGDTVEVPAGSVTWTSTLVVTKGISIRGAGIGMTTIVRAGGSAVRYLPDSTNIASNATFRLSGFTFDGNGQDDVYGMVNVENDTVTPISNVVVTDNKLQKRYQWDSDQRFRVWSGRSE